MGEGLTEFKLRVAADRMGVLLDCPMPGEDMASLAARIVQELSSLGIASPPTPSELEQLLRHAAESNPRLVNVVIAEGEEPVPGKDGAIEWTEDFFSSSFAVDENTGAIDYWRRTAQVTVREGQLLARAMNPVAGRDGRDVLGNRIRVPKPKRPRIFGGPNVQVEEKDGTRNFYAAAQGRIRWASDVISVDEIYTVQGSVGLETGYIIYPGVVVVKKDVLRGSRIEAGGEVEVMGTVEAADILAGGGITVHGGMTGGEGRTIKAAGSIHAKFILNAEVEAGEDIVVEREIVNSTVKAGGMVSIPRGRVVGGEISALGGIVVGQAGSEGLVPTHLVAGMDPSASAEKDVENEASEAPTKPVTEKVERVDTERYEHADIQRDEADLCGRPGARIVIKGTIHPETVLSIRSDMLQVRETLVGPLYAVRTGGKVSLESGEPR